MFLTVDRVTIDINHMSIVSCFLLGKVITFTYPEEDFVVQRFSNELGVPIVARKMKSKT